MDRKLDLSGVRIYTNAKCDIIDAINLIGEEIYLSDDMTFESYRKGNLLEVKYANGVTYPFLGGYEVGSYKYFILAKDAKFVEEEKILRPFKDVIEFRTVTGRGIGGVITYKKKDNDAEYTVLINGYVRINDNVLGIYLGRQSYTLKELRDDYLYLHIDVSSSEWKPFGVEE